MEPSETAQRTTPLRSVPLTAAAGNQLVYFPAGTYKVIGLNYSGTSRLIGDGIGKSTIQLAPNSAFNAALVRLRGNNSLVKDLSIIGNLHTSNQPVPCQTIGILFDTGLSYCRIENVYVASIGFAVSATRSSNCVIRNVEAFDCVMVAVYAPGVFNLAIQGCYLHQMGQAAISVSGQGILIDGNRFHHTGPVGGRFIIGTGSSNVRITNNMIQGTTGGGELQSTTNADLSSDSFAGGRILVADNTFYSNLWDGFHGYGSGVTVVGNVFADNGYGIAVTDSQTIEPGITARMGYPGLGYLPGDILTVSGGTGTRSATAVVVMVVTNQATGSLNADPSGPSGGISWTGHPAFNNMVYPLDMGAYTTFLLNSPNDSAAVTGGHGNNMARVIYTNAMLLSTGSAYSVGDILRVTGGTNQRPAEFRVTSIGGSGGRDWVRGFHPRGVQRGIP